VLRGGPAPEALPVPASLLKPLCGDEPGLAENLASFVRQDYAAPVQIILGVQDPADPALQVAERLRREHPAADIAVVVDGRAHGANRKVSNLINMLEHARHELLVISDADIRAPTDYLRRVAAAAREPGAGVVTCFYVGQGEAGCWSRLAAMGISYGFLPNVVLGAALGLAQPCMGSTIALRRPVLDEIGGLRAFSDLLADDYEIGRAARARGHRVVLPPFIVTHGCGERSLGELYAHELRWAVTVRSISPPGHLGSLITHPVPLALIGAALLGAPAYALAVLAAAIAARLLLMWSVDRAVGTASGPWLLLPLRDIVSFWVFISSLFARSVDWRGARFRVSSNRTLAKA
jgi:ceramide glucosyltransferase